MKRCYACKKTKKNTAFNLDNSRGCGLQPKCRACERLGAQRRKAQQKDAFYRRKYGVSLETVLTLTEAQQSKCKICNEVRPLVVDHCHEKKQFRGLICNACNLGLGKFKESAEVLENAIRYLQSHTL